jgi:hypothetical protein
MAYADVTDVESDLDRSLTDAETAKVEGWLQDAGYLIDAYTGFTGDDPPAVFTRVSVNMTTRALDALGIVAGAASEQEQTGPFGRTVTFTSNASSGGVWLSATDKMMLTGSRVNNGMVSVQLGSERYIEPV